MNTDNANSELDFSSKGLHERISQARPGSKPIEDKLSTDERVFARITDGIYREPASALRELISNAYDADATDVVITTDFPRFSSITIKDNGNGLSEQAVARLVKHIGGSSKRTVLGRETRTVNENDSTLSPGGRKLIGKIGIGLFAVSQLTNSFRIITKEEEKDFYVVIDVSLTQYKEDDLADSAKKDYQSGAVLISKEKAGNLSDHGTEIILKNLKPASRKELSSFNLWERISSEKSSVDAEDYHDEHISVSDDFKEEITTPPRFHIGKIDKNDKEYVEESANLPWKSSSSPVQKFNELVNNVIDEQVSSSQNPSLSTLLDNYLQTIWNLSLSAPLEYLDFKPWEQSRKEGFRYFKLSNSTKGQATELTSDFDHVYSEFSDVKPTSTSSLPFNVYFDGVKLMRPLKFSGLPKNEKNSIKDSLFFFGSFNQDLSTFGEEYSGGTKLKFSAFAFWNSTITPKEHRGVIIRVNDASGDTFDSTFLGYQVSEQTRLRQITFEINVQEGLDAAINIDRESFNYAHPHYQIIKRWVHSAIRQIVNKLKKLAGEIQANKKSLIIEKQMGKIEEFADEQWRRFSTDNQLSEPPSIKIIDMPNSPDLFKSDEIRASRMAGQILIDKDLVVPNARMNDPQLMVKIQSITKILHAFGVLEDMDYKKQHELIRAITKIFTLDD